MRDSLLAYRQSVCMLSPGMLGDRSTAADCATGFSALLFLAGFLVQGNPPSPDESTATISAYLVDHRNQILAGDVILAVGAAPFFWFLGVFRGHLADAGERRLSAASALGAAVGVGIVVAGMAVQAGLVLNTAEASPELVRFGFDAFNALITIAGTCFAVATGAAALSASRSGALPRWLCGAGAVTALLHIGTLPGLFAESGPWAAAGQVPVVVFVVLVVWYVAVAVHLMRTRSAPMSVRSS